MASCSQLHSDETVKKAAETIVETVETERLNAEKDSIEGSVRDHLRGFSRTIPAFLMAYGDENTTLANFDSLVPEEVFWEVTVNPQNGQGVTLDQFRMLRDGGDYKGVRDLTKPTIEELIKRGRCICGAEICNGNDAYNHLMAELAYVPPESIGNTVRHYRDKLKGFSRPAERVYESLTERFESVYRSKTRIQEWEDELLEISSQIKGKENMRQYETELLDVKKRLRDLNAKKERLIRDDQAQKSDIDRYKKVYDSLVAVSGKNKEIMTLIEYAEEIHDWLVETYSQKEGTIREALETKVNEIFERMYHGHRRVVIDQKYQVSLLTTIAEKEIAAGESEGSNRVKNFAFIAGLVALAKEKIMTDSSENGFDLSSEPYPLVMDAPFSNADETHTANISKVLPEIAEQVIMFVMHKDWRYAEPVMSQRVGKQYQLNKISETFTRLQ